MALDWMPQGQIEVDLVAIATADSDAPKITCLFELCDDSLHSPLSNTDSSGNVTEADLGVIGQTQQHVCVVGEKRPRCCAAAYNWFFWVHVSFIRDRTREFQHTNLITCIWYRTSMSEGGICAAKMGALSR